MLAKLKHRLHRAEKALARLFRSRSRKPNIRLEHMDWDGLRALNGVLDQNPSAFEPLSSAVATLSACIQAFDDQSRAREEYGTLRIDLNDLFRALSDYFRDETASSEATRQRVVNLAREIGRVIQPLRRRMEQNEVESGGRDVGDMGEVLHRYRDARTLLARFMLNENAELWKILGEVP
ncbi:hypothetical protein FRC08_005845, partial [Ceratobasidium sp. 394]